MENEMGQHTQVAPQTAARERGPIWSYVIVGAVMFIIGLAIGGFNSSPTPTAATSSPGTVLAQPPAVAPVQAAPEEPKVIAVPGVTDGNDYEVGHTPGNIPTGHYHTDGTHPDGSVAYATVYGPDGQIVKVINIDGPSNLTLTDGQKFSTHGGVVWVYDGGDAK
jgi:hypothetical protein